MNANEYFYEVDGPPRAYFELISAQPSASTNFVGVYESVYIYGNSEQQVREYFDQLLDQAYQPDTEEIPPPPFKPNPNTNPNTPPPDRRTQFLIWRKRPVIESNYNYDESGGDKLIYLLYARLWISNFTFASLTPEDPVTKRYVWRL